MTTDGRIKRGVSLYSFQQAYFLRELTLEQCIAKAAELGALGIETIAEQMMPGYPNLPDEFYAQWHGWMERYGTRATCHDAFFDFSRRKGHVRSDDDLAASLRRDIDHASRLGAYVIRVIVITTPDVVEQCIPYAAEKGIKLALEIHSPFHFDHPRIRAHTEVYEKYGPEAVGYMPDMGIFVRRVPRVALERFLRDGAREEIVRHVEAAYEAAVADGRTGEALSSLVDEVQRMGGSELDVGVARYATHLNWSDPQRLLDFMPYIHHIHAKFYEMTGEGSEYSIPYEEVVPVLAAGGFDGYLSSEYEGQRWVQDTDDVDEVEQVRRQQELFRRILGEAS